MKTLLLVNFFILYFTFVAWVFENFGYLGITWNEYLGFMLLVNGAMVVIDKVTKALMIK